MRPRTALSALFAVLLVVVTGCTGGDDAVARGATFTFVSPGGKTDIFYENEERQKVPDISGEDLFDENKQISVSDFAGKVVVINVWGQWCGPCRTEAPELQKVYEQMGEHVQVLGIDVRDHDRSAPQDFMRNRNLTYPSIYDPPGRSLLQLSGYPRNVVPSTIIVDKDQRVAAVFLRELLASDVLPVVERLAAEK
ncbi:alkyl hydroperoxide reductase [Prauserella marina]|uniref:Thiol-disulfide isomerase or thioredoxin n=1 Tax=Prauserella marina TaxID=530584 RepID=A0A222VJG8_9PSEU|nr:TlpA disulfide reductase family protein [Prauserella marina]ASR33972.1 alkyl hydroperoxide reductase [Prauserella marina]PWV82584.1 thiol-disulfide isomerase/thioredoxin [Prauserella marina]SDC72521.1 Thiol-disulfide isomerase or thioredoxin [Prauserella marina]